jgi:hypothetical protein
MGHGGKRAGAGRKFGVHNKLTADVKATLTEICKAHTPEMVELLLQIARGRKATSAQLKAIDSILDRGNGKPTQTTAMTGPAGGPVVVRLPVVEPDALTWQKRHAPMLEHK